jgi:hypothetical protein
VSKGGKNCSSQERLIGGAGCFPKWKLGCFRSAFPQACGLLTRGKETAQFPIPQKELRGSSEEVPATAINTLQRFR